MKDTRSCRITNVFFTEIGILRLGRLQAISDLGEGSEINREREGDYVKIIHWPVLNPYNNLRTSSSTYSPPPVWAGTVLVGYRGLRGALMGSGNS